MENVVCVKPFTMNLDYNEGVLIYFIGVTNFIFSGELEYSTMASDLKLLAINSISLATT